VSRFRQPHKTKVSNSRTNRVIENVCAEQKAMKVQARFDSRLRVCAKLLKKGVLERVAELVTQTLVETPNESRRVEQSLIIICRIDCYSDKNSLLIISLTTRELSFKANEPIITLTTQAVFTLSAGNHKPLTCDVPGAERQSRLCDVRAITTRILFVEIAAIAYPYGRRTRHYMKLLRQSNLIAG